MKIETLKTFTRKVWNKGNTDVIPELVADEYRVIRDPGDPWGGMELDVAGFQHRVSRYRAPVTDQHFDFQEMYESENSVCVTWFWSGAHRGEKAGIPPSGNTLRMSGATVYYFENSKITGHWQIADRLGGLPQMQTN